MEKTYKEVLIEFLEDVIDRIKKSEIVEIEHSEERREKTYAAHVTWRVE